MRGARLKNRAAATVVFLWTSSYEKKTSHLQKVQRYNVKTQFLSYIYVCEDTEMFAHTL